MNANATALGWHTCFVYDIVSFKQDEKDAHIAEALFGARVGHERGIGCQLLQEGRSTYSRYSDGIPFREHMDTHLCA